MNQPRNEPSDLGQTTRSQVTIPSGLNSLSLNVNIMHIY